MLCVCYTHTSCCDLDFINKAMTFFGFNYGQIISDSEKEGHFCVI